MEACCAELQGYIPHACLLVRVVIQMGSGPLCGRPQFKHNHTRWINSTVCAHLSLPLLKHASVADHLSSNACPMRGRVAPQGTGQTLQLTQRGLGSLHTQSHTPHHRQRHHRVNCSNLRQSMRCESAWTAAVIAGPATPRCSVPHPAATCRLQTKISQQVYLPTQLPPTHQGQAVLQLTFASLSTTLSAPTRSPYNPRFLL